MVVSRAEAHKQTYSQAQDFSRGSEGLPMIMLGAIPITCNHSECRSVWSGRLCPFCKNLRNMRTWNFDCLLRCVAMDKSGHRFVYIPRASGRIGRGRGGDGRARISRIGLGGFRNMLCLRCSGHSETCFTIEVIDQKS